MVYRNDIHYMRTSYLLLNICMLRFIVFVQVFKIHVEVEAEEEMELKGTQVRTTSQKMICKSCVPSERFTYRLLGSGSIKFYLMGRKRVIRNPKPYTFKLKVNSNYCKKHNIINIHLEYQNKKIYNITLYNYSLSNKDIITSMLTMKWRNCKM